jgi:tetratricopeptide (TPR) repeat protein
MGTVAAPLLPLSAEALSQPQLGGGHEHAEEDYPARYATFVARALQLALDGVLATPGLLPEERVEHAFHMLDMTLRDGRLWPQVRELLLALAPKLEQAGGHDQWPWYLNRGLQQSEQQGDRRASAEFQWQLGLLCRLRSNFAEARHWLETAAHTFAALGDAAGEARAFNQLAYLAWQQHQYAEALTQAHTALALTQPLELERAMSLSALGLVAIDQNRWGEAEAYHREALRIRTAHDDQRRMAWSLQNLGYALRGQQRYLDAQAKYQQAIAILDALPDPIHAAIARMNLGIVHSLSGESAQALALYRRAEQVFRRHHDLHNWAKISTNQALEYLNVADWVQAEAYFLTAIRLFEQVGDVSLRLNAMDGLGQVYLHQARVADAMAVLAAALAALDQIQGTAMYDYLLPTLQTHLQQAKQASGAAA